jgi:RimJ/RimL family protein N-acetyltransferase
MKLVPADQKQIRRIVDLSKAAFDSDITIGASSVGGPPAYDSVAWHEQMFYENHLFQVEEAGEIVGGALLFPVEDGKTLYIGRIFVNPILHRKGYGISIMKLVESYYPTVKKIVLDTPLWNVRTNAFYKKLGYSEVKRDAEFAYYQKELD